MVAAGTDPGDGPRVVGIEVLGAHSGQQGTGRDGVLGAALGAPDLDGGHRALHSASVARLAGADFTVVLRGHWWRLWVTLAGALARVSEAVVPVPGGIGVAEAGLSAGLAAVGVDQSTAFAIALTDRLCTYYVPPLWGYFALRWLNRKAFL